MTQRLMKPGNWSLRFVDNCPRSIYATPVFFDQLVIVPTRLEPLSGFSDVNVLANAIYTGVYHTRTDPLNMEGAGLEYFLGTPNGTGMLVAENLQFGSPSFAGTFTLSQAIDKILPNPFASKAVNNTGTTSITGRDIPGQITCREWLDAIMSATGAEWYLDPANGLHAGTAANLFVTTPTTVVTRHSEGVEGSLRGLAGTDLVAAADVQQYVSSVQTINGVGVLSSATFPAVTQPYADFFGNFVRMERVVAVNDETDTAATAIRSDIVSKYGASRTNVSLSSNTYAVDRFVRCGDTVYVFDQMAGLVDPVNQIQYRGELISPIKMRVYGLTWPVQQGMGVYLRSMTTGFAVYTDLTDYIAWDSGGVEWEVGATDRTLTGDMASVGSVTYLGNNADVASASLMGQWTAVTFTGAWTNFGGVYQTVQYRKIGDIVWVRGALKSGVSATSAFTLPTGYRPPATLNLAVGAGGLHAEANITSAGAFAPICSSTAYIDVSCQFSVTT